MSDPSKVSRVRFGVFSFDQESGELWCDENKDRVAVRLPPQPARLLSHLIERRPHLVTRDEIHQLLWPDIEVAFEPSLHTCIRQVRVALGESASSPQYLQTIPRRGYRFVGTVDKEANRIPSRGAKASRRPLRLALAMAMGVAIMLAVAWFRFEPPPSHPTRVAVMPFEPTNGSRVLSHNNDIAESVVKILTNRHTPAIEIIGPTTTQLYDGRAGGIHELIENLDIDYVVNTRESTKDSRERLLIEIIRGSDSAHVWANYLDELPTGKEAAVTIAEAVVETMS